MAFWLAATTIVGVGTGCKKEHRVSLHDLVAMEQAAAHIEEIPEPQAAEVVERVNERLGPYRIGTGDVLRVTLVGGEQREAIPTAQVRVSREGHVELPIAGKLKVAGLELEDVEAVVQGAYVPGVYQDVVVHVELMHTERVHVLVVGAVANPGLVPLRRTEVDMLHALVTAGGLSEMASGQATLRRIRRPHESITLNLTDPVQLQESLALAPLEQGDIIEVHAAPTNMVFVGGLVNRPSPQEYRTGSQVSILQALAAAGGIRTEVLPKEGTLVRRMPDGTDVHVKLDLDRLAIGQDPNILLAPGDILWVPHTFGTRTLEFINNNFFFRAGVSVNYNVTGIEFLNRQRQQAGQFGSRNLQDQFDPLGFLSRNTALRSLSAQPAP